MSHINKKGNPYIIDISNKDVTERVAVASGEIKFDKETYKKIKSFDTKKGNLEKTAIIGGIMGAKETSRLIPLCHNIPINHINIEVIKSDKKFSFIVKSTVKTNANTGVEMEALTAVTISCLTIYDMCKYLNKKIKIQNIARNMKTAKCAIRCVLFDNGYLSTKRKTRKANPTTKNRDWKLTLTPKIIMTIRITIELWPRVSIFFHSNR